MPTATVQRAIADARSVSAAAAGLARAIERAEDAAGAAEHLELIGTTVLATTTQGFDGDAQPETDEDRLATSAAAVNVGLTLLAAQASLGEGDPNALRESTRLLDRTADDLEVQANPPLDNRLFDAHPGGVALSSREAALTALDEMSASAASVATAILDKALKPLVDKVPESVTNVVSDLELDLPGRIARLGFKAVRRGLDLLLSLVGSETISRLRTSVDEVLSRLGRGEDAVVICGWAIGADDARASLSEHAQQPDGGESVLAELTQLADHYTGTCTTLRRIGVAMAGIGGLLAVLQVSLPHAALITAASLALVLIAAIAIGRDHTGATDLPGSIRGVRLVLASGDGRS